MSVWIISSLRSRALGLKSEKSDFTQLQKEETQYVVSVRDPAMLEDCSNSGKVTRLYNNHFYTAIMEENVRAIEDMSKSHGVNCLIETQHGACGGAFWKGFAVPPLHVAASCRRAKSVLSLLSAGADVEIKDRLGQSALHLVIINWPSIQMTSPNPGSKFWSAVTAARYQAETCLRLLCKHGADVNAQMEGNSHQTALHLSVRYRALPAVGVLTSFGADVNAVDHSGMTPLHMAAAILHKGLTASLIRHGADPNMGMQQSGNTPLHLAVIAVATRPSKVSDEEISCVSELLEKGVKPNIVNEEGMSPLHLACSMGREELMDLLLTHGANVNEPSAVRESCLFLFLNHIANVKNRTLLMKLLSLTSPLTIFNHNGCSPASFTQPYFFKQRNQIIKLMQQPRTLKNICKREIYLKCVSGRKEELTEVLPVSLYVFVFNQWDIQHLSLEEESETVFVK